MPPSVVAPPLAGRVMSEQRWSDVAFLHWAVDPERVTCLLPAGTRPDVVDGVTYVGLVMLHMERVGPGRGHPVPWLGTFLETNVRLYSVDSAGRHGVVFGSLDAERLPTVLAARWGYRLPYAWSRMRSRSHSPDDQAWTLTRRWPRRGLRSRVRIRLGAPVEPSALDVFVTGRWGLHSRLAGHTMWTPIEHEPWLLHSAEVLECRDDLVAAAGPAVAGPPTVPVRWSPGVHSVFGFPRRL